MTGKEYVTCFVLFGFAGALVLYATLRMQQFLPWFFPQCHTTPLSPDLALNTAISFSTTSTWQAYAGENTMSYFSQMVNGYGRDRSFREDTLLFQFRDALHEDLGQLRAETKKLPRRTRLVS